MFPLLILKYWYDFFQVQHFGSAKHQWVPFKVSNKVASRPFSLISSNVWGPSKLPSHNGCRLFISFIDDDTKITWLYLIKTISALYLYFEISYDLNQFDVAIKHNQMDNAKEYLSQSLCRYFNGEGIVYWLSCIDDTLQLNSMAKRENHYLDNVA